MTGILYRQIANPPLYHFGQYGRWTSMSSGGITFILGDRIMNTFRQAREIIKSLGVNECFSIQRCYSVPVGNPIDTHKDLIVYETDGRKVGKTIRQYKFRTNWRRRLAVLESLARR